MNKPTLKQIQKAEAVERLKIFFSEQKRHWKRLRKGIMPDDKIIKGWIEACDFAAEDLKMLFSKTTKGDK